MNHKEEAFEVSKILNAVDPKIGQPLPEEFKSGRDAIPPDHQCQWRHREDDDDDDDPPPCPAVIAPLPRLPPFGAEAELEAA